MKGKDVVDWIRKYDMEEKDLHVEIPQEGPCGLFECFHCLHRSLVWQSDFMFEDYGYEGEGIVQNLTCMNCGAEVEYRVPLGNGEESSDE